MFNRNQFDGFLNVAQNHLDLAGNDPVELHNALVMMMNAMRVLADSCENDLKNQLKDLSRQSNTGIAR